eukprot:TRINITY_DN121026_c0_g1_i1.p1 TRINITY_DN121026_c0_g1~~TRINITY_DN121026_c0_g1_i1.p1  ORF type:complete len:338 (-),score=127.95 TRINITY_DN121026_c0_g1_i1:118-1131(-)
MAPADDAAAHLKEAEKALKPSWMSLKFAPDFLTASMEFTNAATKYRAANMLSDAVKCWVRAAETKEQSHDQFGAARAYESAGAICEGNEGCGGADAAQAHWKKAILAYRLSGKSESAAKLLLKKAALAEKKKDMAAAKEAFADAIEVYTDDDKDYNLGDVWKSYIGFLLRAELYDEAVKAMDGHIAFLMKQTHLPFVYKEVLSKVIVLLHTKDTVRADEALRPSQEVDGWYMSKESQCAHDLVAAFQANDPAGVTELTKDQIFTFLQVEVARLAKKLQIFGAVAPAPAAAARPAAAEAATGGGYTAAAAPAPPMAEAAPAAAPKADANADDLAAMLM